MLLSFSPPHISYLLPLGARLKYTDLTVASVGDSSGLMCRMVQQFKVDCKTDSFIVLHTDGMLYVMSDEEITDLVQTCPDAEHAANILTHCAIQYGSEDNITAIIIPLRLWTKKLKQEVSKEHSFLKNMRINYI
ncbi:protein phosphatase 1K, mitochondrial-like [Stylophora pistillata]|uniref:protein phosphatase 1K, mitochondrial-like n=1 Tax=Stylophora pistillata TaxID=50429 RepID=UPI000C03A21F|nr:protein phosphatase 1K, mitochondrial-like [Stylophora pistillata]